MPTSVRSRIPSLLVTLLLLAMLATTACNGTNGSTDTSDSDNGTPAEEPAETPDDTDAETPTTEPEPAETATVFVYFVRGESLGVGAREIADAQTPARAAMEALLQGPSAAEKEFGLDTVVPEGTSLLGIDIDGDTATVDLSVEYGSGGGSLSMLLRVAQVVYTVTQFPGVEVVDFEIDGEPIDYLGGEGIDVVSVGRADFEGQLPPILLESPAPDQSVASPVTIKGLANTFEGSFAVNVTDPEGLIIAEEIVTYTGGTGTHGPFELSIPFETTREGLGAVIVFEKSAKDGSPINVIEVPVRMAP